MDLENVTFDMNQPVERSSAAHAVQEPNQPLESALRELAAKLDRRTNSASVDERALADFLSLTMSLFPEHEQAAACSALVRILSERTQ